MRSAALILLAVTMPLTAQWLNHPDPKIPRNADGSPDLTAPVPMLNGVPDLSGVWESERTPNEELDSVLGEGTTDLEVDIYDINKYFINLFWPSMPPPNAPLTPAGLARMQTRETRLCLPEGLPRSLFAGLFKIVQTPQEVVILHENPNPQRQIYLDGRDLEEDPNPAWMGHSVGRWEDKTLVVETNGMNTRASLDALGHPRSESMRMTERYTRRDVGHMDLEISFNDPVYYTEPFSIQVELTLKPDTDILEYVCAENERDQGHMQ